MYCKATNTANKSIQYLTKAHSILKKHGIFDRFKIEDTRIMSRYDSNGEVIEYATVDYMVDGEFERICLDKEKYDKSTQYPVEIRDTIFFLLSIHAERHYPESPFNLFNLPFNKEELEILALAGNFFIWNVFYTGEISGKNVDVPNMKLFNSSERYKLANMISLPILDIGGELPSFKIHVISSDIVLSVIEPKEVVDTESEDLFVNYLDSYLLGLTFGKDEDKVNLNEERLGILFSSLEGKVVSADTNLRDLYFNSDQYLRIANIKEEKLVSITVEEHGSTTRYLGGLYSGFSMNMSRTEGINLTLPFPNTRVSIGGQEVNLACTMAEIETALGLN
jgi:hypothetical protein